MQDTRLGEHSGCTKAEKDNDEVVERQDERDEDEMGEEEEEEEEDETAEGVATPSLSSRLRKLLLLLAALWLAYAALRGLSKPRKQVIHASRYSEDYKYRPAASPVVTETLKDGRTRIRGAEPSARSIPPEKDESKSKSRSKPKSRKRRSSRRKKSAGAKW